MSALPDDPQTIRVAVDVSGLPAVCALARAARDVVDHADGVDPDEITPFDVDRYALVDRREFAALAAAVEPLYPGPAT